MTEPKPRKIIHVDMDCFYAAVEIRDNPSLRGKPVAVGGRERGVLTTASYEARKFGLKSAMPTAQALKLCPDLILLPVNFEKYTSESRKIRAIFAKYTDKIEPLSLDEAYLDVTDSEANGGLASKTALEIRKRIWEETRLTASAGIAPNKFLAKVASDWKKPNGQFTITPSMIEEFVKTLKVEQIPGVGKVTAAKMREAGITLCHHLQERTKSELQTQYGKWGLRLYYLCRGIDERQVSDEGERKSISVENTYPRDLQTSEACLKQLPDLFEDFSLRLTKANVKDLVKALVVKVKFHDFTQTTLERSGFSEPTIEAFSSMIESAFERGQKPVRLLGIGVKLKSESQISQSEQLSLIT